MLVCGVGHAPLPAVFVSRGLDVLATDQGAESGDHWASTGELMAGLSGLSRSHVVTDEELAAHVEIRNVDMNSVPADLGTFDVIWSSCAIEHLGSPEQGLNFVIDTCRLRAPGGSAVHTTELERTERDTPAEEGRREV